MVLIIFITVWVIGSILSFLLMRFALKKTNENLDDDLNTLEWDTIILIILFSIFLSWINAIIGLIINLARGNFKFKSKPPTWLS